MKWLARYSSSTSGNGGASEFCGLSFTELEDVSVSLGCGTLMASIGILLAPFGPAPRAFDTPMESDALSRIRDPVSDDNPLVDFVPLGARDSRPRLVHYPRGAY